MSNPCDGGDMVPKDGIGPIIVYDAAKLLNLFTLRGLGWLSSYLPQIGGQNYDLDGFCGSGRPDPETDPGTIANYFSPINPTGVSDLNHWLVDLANLLVWNECCTCDPGGPPTPPPTIPQPPGLTLTPPNTAPPVGATCLTGSIFASINNPGVGQGIQSYPNGTFGALVGKNCSSVVIQEAWSVVSGAFQFTVTYQAFTGAGQTILGQKVVNNIALNNQTLTFQVPAGTNYLGRLINNFGGTGQAGEFDQWNYYCGGTSPTGVPGGGSCPPDQTLAGLIQQVLDQVNLIQTYRLPFAYVPGATHSGITGSGSFAVSRLLGVKLSNMVIPTSYGTALGNPNYYFDLGWLSILTGDGFIDEVRIHSDGQVWLPNQMQQALVLGYTLNPGVHADITELEAENLNPIAAGV